MKIKDASVEDLNKSIKIAAMTAGLHNPPQQELIDNLILPFIKSSYPNLELSEFNNAFIVYARQELDFKEKPFDLFSCPFIGSIISSYGKYTQNKRNVLKSKENGVKALLPEADIDYGKENFNFIKDVFLREGKEPMTADWGSAYKYAEKIGLIKNEEKYIEKELERIKNTNQDKAKRARIMKENYHHLIIGSTPHGALNEFYKNEIIKYFEM